MPPMSLDLTRLLDDNQQDTPSQRGTLEAQAMELQARFAAYQVKHSFAPGDLVREKPGLGKLKAESRDNIQLIYWRDLAWGDPFDREIIRDAIANAVCVTAVNCIVAFRHDDGVGIAFLTHDKSQLEPA